MMKRLKELANKLGTLNIILFLVGAFFIWFTWQMIILYRDCGGIPDGFACTVVTALIGECGICGWIRTTKDRRQERKWEKEDRKLNKEEENHDI